MPYVGWYDPASEFCCNPIGRKEGVLPLIAAGSSCPDFSLPDSDGYVVTLENLKGSPFVLYFYPKDDTSGCTIEALDFTALMDEFGSLSVAVLGVSPDAPQQHCKFRDKHGLTVRLLSDENKMLLQDFGVWTEKSMYGRTYMGVERTTVLFDANAIARRVWPKVTASGHAANVLEAARSMTAPA